MIVGLGNDIVYISRIEELIKKFGDRFIDRSYTKSEKEAAQKFGTNNNRGKYAFFAKRFAAKEACAKALGTGFRNGLRFTHIEVTNDKLGKPYLILTSKALELSQSMVSEGKKPVIHLTMADDYPLAQATVIISEE
jgi:holo-[acyl-carrier protein] synthase